MLIAFLWGWKKEEVVVVVVVVVVVSSICEGSFDSLRSGMVFGANS